MDERSARRNQETGRQTRLCRRNGRAPRWLERPQAFDLSQHTPPQSSYKLAMPEKISAEECRAQAHECYQKAQEIRHPEARRELLSLVVKWSKLADMIEGDRRKLH